MNSAVVDLPETPSSSKNEANHQNKKPIDLKNEARKKIKSLLKQITNGLYEREQIVSIALLGAISGQNTFLFGPPGTAKSLISRRLACAFEKPAYFEYLMNRFSSPDDVFGPVSIKELKQDNYTRKVEGYLPKSDFAFLDEIWKSSPAILNALLTLINEKKFKNGAENINVPLKSLIAASNEVPVENQGLDALYDRFILRLPVMPISDENNFNKLLNSKPSSDKPNVEKNLKITYEELKVWQKHINAISLSNESLIIIKTIRAEFANQFDQLGVYVSDRRWQRSAMLLKASAFCNGRNTTNHSDLILLKYCLWTSPENREDVAKIVMQAIKDNGFVSDANIASLDKEKDSLEKEINKELYHTEDVYDVITLKDNKKYFKVDATFKCRGYSNQKHSEIVYIEYNHFKKSDKFHPMDENGNKLASYTCKFDNQGSCEITYNSNHYHYHYENIRFTPDVLFHKSDKKNDINTRLISSLSLSVNKIKKDLQDVLKNTETKFNDYKLKLESHFVTSDETNIAVSGIIDQIKQLKIRIKDCERLEALCK